MLSRQLSYNLCGQGDHVVSSRTIYGGTYAFLKNFAPRFGVATTFVDITKLDIVEAAITPNTKIIYCETVSNPLLEVADIASLAKIAKKHNLKLVVDNTFSPLSVSPATIRCRYRNSFFNKIYQRKFRYGWRCSLC